ncbi:hypothetical protein Glo7428_1513 [Gloeocapsa sp. PCC 7428]|nr:hypothetical protein Glo7428_1513 [Gloeocapsa sp. PCC 7428]
MVLLVFSYLSSAKIAEQTVLLIGIENLPEVSN